MTNLGRATIARITAQRLGCKDERVLKLIEKLASADLVVEESPTFFGGQGVADPFCLIVGTMDGKRFELTLAGEAVKDFV